MKSNISKWIGKVHNLLPMSVQVFYIDNIDFGDLTPSKKMLPRFLDFPYRLLKTLEKEDRQHVAATLMAEYQA